MGFTWFLFLDIEDLILGPSQIRTRTTWRWGLVCEMAEFLSTRLQREKIIVD
jgi:hypothetical protein